MQSMVEFSADFPFRRRKTDVQSATPVERATDNPPPISTPETAAAAPAPTPVEQPPAPQPAARKPLIERRKYMRDRMTAHALIHVDGAKGPPAKVTLTDISIAGARFSAAHPLDVGEKLQIRVEVGPFRWTTRMRVIHCTRPTPQGDSTIGCAFLRTELLRPWPAAA